MGQIEQSTARNHLIARLSAEDFAAVQPHLRTVDLRMRSTLHAPNVPITSVFFPQTGYVSILAVLEDGDAAEVGMIGYEGVAGVGVFLGGDRSPLEAMVQGEGAALQLDSVIVQALMESSPSFRMSMLQYVLAFNLQVAMTAACNSRHLIEQRLARWLLMAHDRSTGDTFPITHELLGLMLGVRRAGITVAAGALQRAGYVRWEPGRTTVLERSGLESAACECHGIVRAEYRRLLQVPEKR